MEDCVKSDQVHMSAARSRWGIFLQYCAFAAMLFGIKLWLIGSFGNATPYWDQWDGEANNLYRPFLEGTLRWTDLFTAFNEHRIFTTRILALALFIINGIWNPLLQMVVNAGLHIITVVLGIVLLTRVIGKNHLSALLFFSIVFFGVPYGWYNTLGGFQSEFYFVLLFSIACLWLTVNHLPLSARWWGGVVCGILGFLSMASGIFALAAAASVSVVLYAMKLRKTHKQLAAVAILTGLFILGVVLTPTLPEQITPKASLPELVGGLITIFSWPMSPNFFLVILLNSPALVFIGLMLWKHPPANDRRWFLLTLFIWVLGQAASIAYGRPMGPLTTRYLDLFAIGILVNFACFISIAQDYVGNQRGWIITGIGVWTIIVFISLGLYAGKHISAELVARRDAGLAEEFNTRNYLSTGDFNYLKDKPLYDVPYPDPERLASILSSPTIRAFLPANIRLPLAYTSIKSKPDGTFVDNGYYPSTPKPIRITWGSYSAQGDKAKGQAWIGFDTSTSSTLLAIPVAGYPLDRRIQLVIEQNGHSSPVVMKSNPGNSWEMAYAEINRGAFSVHLIDSTVKTWLAVGVPVVVGRLDVLTNDLLSNYSIFMISGLAAWVLSVTLYGITTGAGQ